MITHSFWESTWSQIQSMTYKHRPTTNSICVSTNLQSLGPNLDIYWFGCANYNLWLQASTRGRTTLLSYFGSDNLCLFSITHYKEVTTPWVLSSPIERKLLHPAYICRHPLEEGCDPPFLSPSILPDMKCDYIEIWKIEKYCFFKLCNC